MRKKYQSDITREQVENIRPILENGRKRQCRQSRPMRSIFRYTLFAKKRLSMVCLSFFQSGASFAIVLAYRINSLMKA